MAILGTINALLGRGTWPPPELRQVWEEVELYAAFRRSDDTRLRQERSVEWWRDYMLSPVPRMISRASANLLFGEPPEIKPQTEADQPNLDRIVSENELDAEIHRGAMISSSEGEVWGRVVVQPDVLDVPIIEFVSRRRVIPHFAGRFVIGATFVTTWLTGAVERYRLFESYEAGTVISRLYRGTTTSLGTEVSLDSFDETKGTAPQVNTGIDWPLVAFIPNTIDSDPQRGYSDYAGLTDRFFALNDAGTVGQHNHALAGRKRAIVDAGYVNEKGKLPAGDDVFIRTSREGGDDQKNAPLQVIDYAFQASETIAWLDHLIDSTLTFAGVAPEQVGRRIEGGAVSGVALRLKMAHSLLEASGKGRFWDRGLSRLLRGAQVLDGRRTTEGGFGRRYSGRDEPPAITRHPGLPRDDTEAAEQVAMLVGAEAISLEQRLRFLHPQWTEQQVTDEATAIRKDFPQQAGIATERPPATLNPNDSRA